MQRSIPKKTNSVIITCILAESMDARFKKGHDTRFSVNNFKASTEKKEFQQTIKLIEFILVIKNS